MKGRAMETGEPVGRRMPKTTCGTIPAGIIAVVAAAFAVVNFLAAFTVPAALFWIQVGIGVVVAVNTFILAVLIMVADDLRALRQDRWLGP